MLDLSFLLSPARSRTRETSTSDGSDHTWCDMWAVVSSLRLPSSVVTRSPRLGRDRWCCWSPVKMQIRSRSVSVML